MFVSILDIKFVVHFIMTTVEYVVLVVLIKKCSLTLKFPQISIFQQRIIFFNGRYLRHAPAVAYD